MSYYEKEDRAVSNAGDFIIDNGVLKKYVGPGGDVVRVLLP